MCNRWCRRAAAGILLALCVPAAGTADEPPRSFTIAASGDILIHGSVARAAAAYGEDGSYDFTPMLAPTEPWIAEADLAICHLEGALSADDGGLSYYPLFIAPHTVADAIAAAGYDACSLAGNHALDRGQQGLDETIELLEARGIAHEGTARNEEERLPGLYQVNGVTVAHLDYTYGLNGLPRPAWYSVNIIDPEAILADARWAREHGAEFVVLTIHWGVEYQHSPTAGQEALAARLLASPDIDLILGSHAHVVQPIGRVNNKVVVYGMGNHLSNQNSIWGPKYHSTEDGLMVQVTVAEQPDGRFAATSVEYTPTWVEMHTYRVLPVAWARAAGEGDPALLAASWERTTGYVTMLDTEGLTATPAAWPSLACAGRVAGLVGTTGPDLLIGTSGDDVITGRGGDDTIQGLDGNDLICGGSGDDTLWAGPGFDQLLGGDGDDTLYGGLGRDSLWGQAGDDTLSGGDGDDTLSGGGGHDTLWGHEGDDLLFAGSGTDRLWGGPGADTLVASSPMDIFGADAHDYCRMNTLFTPCP
ncbi:MAG TPA: CapA family protein [Acidimicrobiia bacterium]|nr:CapA family protein [Acidimicrobiia bacterium]